MTEQKRMKSPTGLVHIVGKSVENFHAPLCQKNPFILHGDWPLTKNQATCQLCLRLSNTPDQQLRGLAIEAENIQDRLNKKFRQLAKTCKHYEIRMEKYGKKFPELSERICWHSSRYGTEKHRRACNIFECPLKRER